MLCGILIKQLIFPARGHTGWLCAKIWNEKGGGRNAD